MSPRDEVETDFGQVKHISLSYLTNYSTNSLVCPQALTVSTSSSPVPLVSSYLSVCLPGGPLASWTAQAPAFGSQLQCSEVFHQHGDTEALCPISLSDDLLVLIKPKSLFALHDPFLQHYNGLHGKRGAAVSETLLCLQQPEDLTILCWKLSE